MKAHISFQQIGCKTSDISLAYSLHLRVWKYIFVKKKLMKKALLISLLFLFFICIDGFSQSTSNLVLFSENGEKFTVSVDGEIKNSEPEANVKITNLTGDFHRVMVTFEDKSLGSVNQNLMLEPGLEQKAIIVFTKKGTWSIRPFGEPTALSPTSPAPTPQPTATYSAPATPAPTATSPPPAPDAPPTPSTNVFSMDVNVNENSVGMNVKMTDTGGVHIAIDEGGTGYETTETSITTIERSTDSSISQNPARVEVVDDCSAMAGGDFAEAVKSIESKSFEDTKVTTANQVLKGNCLSTDQIKKVMELMTFEESKINFAKAAHDRCPDPQNYWKLNDAFTFESSIDDLNDYINAK